MSFEELDHENTFSALWYLFFALHPGAVVIGVLSVLILLWWDKVKWLKKSPVPAPLVVVLVGVGISLLLERWGGRWVIGVNTPGASSRGSHAEGIRRFRDMARLLGGHQPAGFHGRDHDCAGGLAGDAAERGGGGQARPAETGVASQSRIGGPGHRQYDGRPDRRTAVDVGDRAEFGQHQRGRQNKTGDDLSRPAPAVVRRPACPNG